jgi:hypothetical protein
MIEFLPSSPKLAAFVAASLVLTIVPGPGVVYLTAQTLAHGRLRGLVELEVLEVAHAVAREASSSVMAQFRSGFRNR